VTHEENTRAIKALWIGLAAYYQVALSDDQVRMYAEDCGHYSAVSIDRAIKFWRQNPKHNRMPLPGQLLEIMGGGESKGNASAIALTLVGAIKRHDYSWGSMTQAKFYKHGSFEADFRAELGDIAWEVVRMAGGWSQICGSFWDSGNETAFKAQMRDTIEHVIAKHRGQVIGITSGSNALAIDSDEPESKEARERLNRLLGKDDA
jgi:hypothetical protein